MLNKKVICQLYLSQKKKYLYLTSIANVIDFNEEKDSNAKIKRKS